MNWIVSIISYSPAGYTELKAETKDGDFVIAKDLEELRKKISERTQK